MNKLWYIVLILIGVMALLLYPPTNQVIFNAVIEAAAWTGGAIGGAIAGIAATPFWQAWGNWICLGTGAFGMLFLVSWLIPKHGPMILRKKTKQVVYPTEPKDVIMTENPPPIKIRSPVEVVETKKEVVTEVPA